MTPTRATLFRLLIPVVAGVVGLVFLVSGVGLALSQSWESATGTASACGVHRVQTGPSNSRQNNTSCIVTWSDSSGQPHTSRMDFGTQHIIEGQTVDLRVNGDIVAQATPSWVGYASAGLGAALVLLAVVLFVRSRRRAVAV